MIATLILVGIGLIVALGGAILLDRERFNANPRHTYRLAIVAGAITALAGLLF